MTFEWDAAKSAETYWRRGFDFAVASMIFEGPVLAIIDTRFDYGERRFIAIGIVDGTYLTVVYTDRDNGARRRIISAWTSNRQERRRYDQAYADPSSR
ncbi:MAG: BrnT family toxin [Gemmatimonadetes bacterium]|nr:BrnT family toxin [Gemmatimonadota bacterium]